MAKKKPLTTKEVRDRLAEKYSGWQWVFLNELRSSNGFAFSVRSADAIAINLYPSHGCEMHGFEIKVSRSDFLKELKDPDKSDIFKQYCDRWFLVVGDSSIVKPGELPAGWGLIVPRGDSLMIKIGANKLEPEPMGRLFYTAIMKRLVDDTPQVAEVRKEAHQKGVMVGKEHAGFEIYALKQRLQDAESSLKIFKELTGESLDSWNPEATIKEIQSILKIKQQEKKYMDEIKRRISATENMLKTLKDYVAVMGGK